MYILVKL